MSDHPTGDDPGLSSTSYDEILRNIHDAVYTLDPDGVITWVNEVAVEEFDGGYSRDELIGAPVTKILSNEDIERCVDLISDLVANDPTGSRRTRIALQTKQGRTIPCDLHLALLPTADGSFGGTLGVARDVTEQRQREQGLSVLNRVLRHNLRNELSILLGALDQLEGPDSVEDAAKTAVDRLLRTSEKAREIEQVLRRTHEEDERVDLAVLAENRVEEAAERFPDADLRCTRLDTGLAESPYGFDAVLDELIENAVIHDDSDHPRVEVAVESSADGERALVTIADDGPGIPDAELAALAAGVESPLQHSSGLGLWLVTWIVERMGGELTFETAEGGGNLAVVDLPVVSAETDRS